MQNSKVAKELRKAGGHFGKLLFDLEVKNVGSKSRQCVELSKARPQEKRL